jgi:hypothetical protein
MELPDSGSEGFGSKLFSVGSALIQAVKKPFQEDRDKKENLIIERVFLDSKGYHSILSTDGGDNYYINLKDSKVRYLQGVRGKVIKAVAWNENCTEEATKVTRLLIIKKRKSSSGRKTARSGFLSASSSETCLKNGNRS